MPTSTKQKIQIPCIIGYPELSAPNEDGKYSGLFLVDDPDAIQAVERLVAAESKLGFQSDTLPAGAFNPIRSAQERKPDGEFAFKSAFVHEREGAIVFRAKSGYAPKTVCGRDRLTCDPADIRGGDECVVEITGYSYKNQSSGVALSLNGVWLINQGNGELERGGSGNAFANFDASKLKFRTPTFKSDDPDAGL